MAQLRVLLLDVESAPLLAHIWSPGDQWVTHDRMIHDSFLLTWGAKWGDQKQILSGVLTSREARNQDDGRIVQDLADLIREADLVVAHNIDRFDLPMLNNRLLVLGQEPLGKVRTIDTLTLARKHFRLAHNKLDYLGEVLGLGRKIKTDFELWKKCYHGDEKALDQMRRYNRRDVVLLEQVFEKLKPYVNNLPRMYEADFPEESACPSCGGDEFIKRGFYRTQASTFQRVQCTTCQRYSRYRASEKELKLGLHPL